MWKRDEVVLWPVYFDLTVTRSEGRKVTKNLARVSPTLEMTEKAVKNLGIPYKVVPEAVYPRFSWRRTGLISVKKIKPKNQILKDVAEELRFRV